jgi:hypothetical protein
VDYETTERNEPFRGTEVSRKSVAALIVKIIDSPEIFVRSNLGVDKPNTDGDKPAFLSDGNFLRARRHRKNDD